ncbi:MAG: hypothetical protein P8104_07785 [Gammaproteobacteria bacterium]
MTAANRIIWAGNPVDELEKLANQLKNINYLNVSKKQAVGNDLGRPEATPSLKYKAVA